MNKFLKLRNVYFMEGPEDEDDDLYSDEQTSLIYDED